MYETATTATNKPTTMTDHMQNIRNELAEAVERLRNIADRVSGSAPRAVGDSPKSAPAFSLYGGASEIKTYLGFLRDEINRLDNSI